MENKEPIAEIKTTVYAAEMGDRTEGNQNWAETGGDLSSRTPTMQEMKDTAAVKAQEAKETVSSYAQSAKSSAAHAYESAKETVSDYAQRARETAHQYGQESQSKGTAMYTPNSAYATSGYAQTSTTSAGLSEPELKERANETAEVAREKLGTYDQEVYTGVGQQKPTSQVVGEKMAVGKEKLGEVYESGAQKLHAAKDYTAETGHNVVDRLRETVGSTASALQHKTHEWTESAQHTLEQAREKAREVFTGAGQKVDEAANKMSSTSTTGYADTYTTTGDTTEIKVKAEEAPTGGIDRLKIEAKSTNAQ